MAKDGKTAGNHHWLKITLETPTPLVESVSDRLAVLSGAGVEISPEKSGHCTISGFFSCPAKEADPSPAELVRENLAELFALYRQRLPELKTERIDDQDWATSWKRFFTPLEIIPGLVIKPSWEEYRAGAGEKIIEMDPGQAFGTGQHESTRMALSLLRFVAGEKERVLDVGTGTGILAMAGVLLGSGPATAVDNDPEAVRVARENVAANGLDEQITVSGTDINDLTGPYDLILANIVHDVLAAMAPTFADLLDRHGHIVLAGILSGEQEKNIRNIYERLGLQERQTLYEGEWAALLLERG